jgi:hypothetical protein
MAAELCDSRAADGVRHMIEPWGFALDAETNHLAGAEIACRFEVGRTHRRDDTYTQRQRRAHCKATHRTGRNWTTRTVYWDLAAGRGDQLAQCRHQPINLSAGVVEGKRCAHGRLVAKAAQDGLRTVMARTNRDAFLI